jgi:hypothetical protein
MSLDKYINIYVDLENTKNYAKMLNLTADAMDRGVRLGLEDVAQQLRKKIVEKASAHGLGGSNLLAGLEVFVYGNEIIVELDNEYASFVEFGTGIKGEVEPHPRWQENGWGYNTGGRKKKIDARGYWFYPKNGKLFLSRGGYKSRPFMYESWLWCRESFSNILRKHINRELKKVSSMSKVME